MTKKIDVRGLSCPEPLMQTNFALQKDEAPLEVLVDSATALQNVTRMAQGKGYKVNVTEKNGEFVIRIDK